MPDKITPAQTLKPCPFCGGKAKFYCQQDSEDTCADWVECTQCLCFVSTDRHEGDGSKYAWNTRIASRAEVTGGADGPTEADLFTLTEEKWKEVKPSRQAQEIRARISTMVDDPRFKQWVLDYTPDYIWNLIDISAQWGLDAAAPASLASQWQPIETAPKDGTEILLCFGSDKNSQGLLHARWHEPFPNWLAVSYGREILDAPTHWQPLPAPPKEQL